MWYYRQSPTQPLSHDRQYVGIRWSKNHSTHIKISIYGCNAILFDWIHMHISLWLRMSSYRWRHVATCSRQSADFNSRSARISLSQVQRVFLVERVLAFRFCWIRQSGFRIHFPSIAERGSHFQHFTWHCFLFTDFNVIYFFKNKIRVRNGLHDFSVARFIYSRSTMEGCHFHLLSSQKKFFHTNFNGIRCQSLSYCMAMGTILSINFQLFQSSWVEYFSVQLWGKYFPPFMNFYDISKKIQNHTCQLIVFLFSERMQHNI